MTDVAKVSWFKAKLIVWAAKYISTKSIDESTIGGIIHAISEYFKDKDEKSILRAIRLLCSKVQDRIDKRFKEIYGLPTESKTQILTVARDTEEGRRHSARKGHWYKRFH
jgi:hypothetical protein